MNRVRFLPVLPFLIVAVFSSCKKEKDGTMRQQIRATSQESGNRMSSPVNTQQLQYTQFGDLITTLTPTSCVGQLEAVRYHEADNDNTNMMTLVMRHPQQGEEAVIADFTNNATVSVTPVLNGNNIVMNPDEQGTYFRENVTFRFLWMRMGLKHVIELPAQYSTVTLTQFVGQGDHAEQNGNILTTDVLPMNQVVQDLSVFSNTINFYFGMTDSTRIDYGVVLNNSPAWYIRSDKYADWTMTPPQPEQTKTVVSTVGFVNDNIIQIYAGADNTPYTSDDIVVMEPRFWEKIYVEVSEY